MNEAPTTESSSQEPVPETSPETPLDQSPGQAEETSESPTYKHDQWYGLDHYICLLCGHEDWSEPTLQQHLEAYHRGLMIEAPPGYEPPPMAEDEPTSVEEAAGTPETGDEPVQDVLTPEDDKD